MNTQDGKKKPDAIRVISYLITFLTLAPLTLVVSFLSLTTLQKEPAKADFNFGQNIIEVPSVGAQVYAALPNQQSSITTNIASADARTEIVRQYLQKYNSPLEPYSNLIVATSDQYNLDYRFLVAIAQQESNLCKKIPEGTYNCWGWGIHSKGTLAFPDYATGIQAVAQGLKEDYLDKGYDTPEKIMTKYTPQSNGSWAAGVTQFLQEME